MKDTKERKGREEEVYNEIIWFKQDCKSVAKIPISCSFQGMTSFSS